MDAYLTPEQAKNLLTDLQPGAKIEIEITPNWRKPQATDYCVCPWWLRQNCSPGRPGARGRFATRLLVFA